MLPKTFTVVLDDTDERSLEQCVSDVLTTLIGELTVHQRKQNSGPIRERALAITKLQEARFWIEDAKP